ncbi:hypothetical protein [Actinomadura litoris]|uniref:Uncharacterized protein n=1 Tax=Actinomadura litoris TaxID=2678616 RepID=A0A7K1LAI4_9ACTN|nr:hypothetical protein [Actinomadura litoris]MUN41424.1 hypothetical protein [Actinomadura litoris]
MMVNTIGPSEDACPGACNRRYRDAWAAYTTAHTAWRSTCAALSGTAAQLLADVPEDEDLAPDAYDALFAIVLPEEPGRLPDPPDEPEVPFTAGEAVTASGANVWCPRCRRRIRAALVEIGDLAATLEAWADGHRGAASGEHIPTRRTTAPSPSPITDMLDALYGMLADVERQWREHAGHPPRPGRSRGGDARQRTLAYLLEQADRILDNPGSPRFGRGILAWQARLLRATKSDPVVRRRPGRCPRCTWVNVLQTRDDGHIECRNCGRLMNEDEYQDDVVSVAGFDVVDETIAARAAS